MNVEGSLSLLKRKHTNKTMYRKTGKLNGPLTPRQIVNSLTVRRSIIVRLTSCMTCLNLSLQVNLLVSKAAESKNRSAIQWHFPLWNKQLYSDPKKISCLDPTPQILMLGSVSDEGFSPLVNLIHALIDLIDASERHSCQGLESEHVQSRGDRAFTTLNKNNEFKRAHLKHYAQFVELHIIRCCVLTLSFFSI